MPTLTSVTKYFPSAKEGFTTTLASSISSGATTVPLNSVTGYTNGDTIVLVVDPTDATKKQAFTGVVDTAGVQITGVVWTEGTNTAHSSGATVVDYATATHMAMTTKGILVHADQDGTLKAGAVDGTTILANAIVTNAKLSTTAGEPGGAWQTFSPTWTNLTPGNGVGNYKYMQIGKTVFFRIRFKFGTTSTMGSIPLVTYPVPPLDINDGSSTTEFSAIIGSSIFKDDSVGSAYNGVVYFKNATNMQPATIDTSGALSLGQTVDATSPFTWATSDLIQLTGMYEAA